MDSFDFAVIGGGPGGYVAAIRAAQLGGKVALIEERPTLGGTCLNVGCIPSKALLESSEHFQAARGSLSDHGVALEGVRLDLPRMMARKERIVGEVTAGVQLLMKKNGVTVLGGRGELAGGGRIRLTGAGGEREVQAAAIVLAMGSEPFELPGLPFDGRRIVSSTEALCFGEVPEHLVVVGAGAIGLELGSVWRRLGSQITVVEILPRITPFADLQLARALQRSLAEQGLEILLRSRVTAARPEGERLRVTVAGEEGKELEIIGDRLLVAVGRRPNSAGAGLGQAGVECDEKGRVRVDDAWRTSAPGVYAIGDLIAGPMLAHRAQEEGVAVAERVAGLPGEVNRETIPSVIYTAPELAQVGLTEEEVRERGLPFKAGRSYFRANGRARCLGEDEGLVKVLAHKETDRLLGVHILGPRASELIAEAVLAMEFQASAEDVGRTCHAHPTLSEVFKEAALAVDRRSIHG